MLPKVDGDKSLLLYYNNVNASILFFPLIFLFEWNVRIIHILYYPLYEALCAYMLGLFFVVTQLLNEHSEKLLSLFFWTAMIITGIMGFAIGLVTVMQVKATSPLTHNISGTAKAAAQVRTTHRPISNFLVCV